MIGKLLMKLGLGDGSLNAESATRRKFIRYNGLKGEVEMTGQRFGIRDWSMGGISFETLPDARIIAGDRVAFTLHFRFPHDTIVVEQQARVLRTGRQGVAAEFLPLSQESRKGFERVLDSIHAQGFLQSQVA
jgi:hypothetical protein